MANHGQLNLGAKILLIEDDPALGRGLHISLQHKGYNVQWARDLKSANNLNAQNSFHLILLDQGLPDGNGIAFLKQVRGSGSRIPVLILTAKTDESSVVEGLESGANDYIRKPFGNLELLARIKIALQEPQNRTRQIRCGELLVLFEQRRVFFQERELTLKRREFDVLSYFVEHFDKVVTREDLMLALKNENEIFDRTIDTHVSHVRSRLRHAGIRSLKITSLYGVGYRLEAA
jgi:DNA-binding response OmpR family regulator